MNLRTCTIINYISRRKSNVVASEDMTIPTNNIQGILISCRDVQYVGKRIDEIHAWENSHHAANQQEEIKLTKAYCRKIIDMLDDCFEKR